jgi:hypothetical protein
MDGRVDRWWWWTMVCAVTTSGFDGGEVSPSSSPFVFCFIDLFWSFPSLFDYGLWWLQWCGCGLMVLMVVVVRWFWRKKKVDYGCVKFCVCPRYFPLRQIFFVLFISSKLVFFYNLEWNYVVYDRMKILLFGINLF